MAVFARFPILVEAARGDAEGDAWRERCDAARRGIPRRGGATTRRRACHEHPDYRGTDSARVKFMYLPNETRRVRMRSTMPSSARVVGLSNPG